MSAPSILEKIYAQRAKDVELAKSTPGTTPADIEALLASNVAPPLISFVERLKRNPGNPSSSPSLMAEIKRASPSKGPIALSANPAHQALTYALSGASTISVLTEPTWFHGSLLDLHLARTAVAHLPDRPAILRKEFILDEYQIAEARLHGADTVLLIVAMLPTPRLKALYDYSLSLYMEPLVEVNNAAEMQIALDLGAQVIGVNNRNLHNFNVDMGTTSRLVDMVRGRPGHDVVLCALSGISTPQDVQVYKAQGVRAVLVGESLMRAENTSAFIRELLQWPAGVEPQEIVTARKPWSFVSGLATVQEVLGYTDRGADMLGITFDVAALGLDDLLRGLHDIARHLHYGDSPPSSSPPASSSPWFATQVQRLLSSPSTKGRKIWVGQFHNQTLEFILYITTSLHLDLVLLDDTAPSTWDSQLPVPVIRRFEVGPYQYSVVNAATPGLHSFILLDRDDPLSSSNFTELVKIVKKGEAGPEWPLPVIIHGGLTPENLEDAIREVRPWAVEVHTREELDALKEASV